MNSALPSRVAPSTPQFKHTFPVFVFFSICGFYFIVVQMLQSDAPDRFLEVHKASLVPLSLTNNKLPIVDKLLTPLISFFIAAFGNPESKAYPTVVDFVWSFGAAIQLPLLEAQRNNDKPTCGWSYLAQRALSFPMVWGILYQRLSGGFILPLWLLCYMHAGTRIRGTAIDSVKAESVLFGWWIGHTLPALAMLVPGQPALTSPPIWIAFPILMSVAQAVYLFIRTHIFPPSSSFKGSKCHSESPNGYVYTKLLYGSALVGSAVAHFHVVLIPGLCAASASSPFNSPKLALTDKLIGLARDLVAFYTPATGLRTPSPASTTADSGVVHFVQFDVLVVFAAVWTALLWDLVLRRRDADVDAKAVAEASVAITTATTAADTTTNSSSLQTTAWVVRVLALLFASSMVAGFGAATAGLLFYREALMEKMREGSVAQSTPLADRKSMVQNEETPLASTYGSIPRPQS